MDFLEKYFKEIKKSIDSLTDINIVNIRHPDCPNSTAETYSVNKDSEYILSSILSKYNRFSHTQGEVALIESNSFKFFTFRFNEFTGSCGRLMIHTFRLSLSLTPKVKDTDITINHTLEFLHGLCKATNYSSFHFMLSKEQNPEMVNSLDNLGIKPINTFKNSRYNPDPHTCYDYIINI